MTRIRIKLSALLGERRVKQSELSRLTGITAATINRYYHEDIDRVSLRDLNMMCEALGCKFSDMVCEETVDDESSAIGDYEWERQTRPKPKK